MLNYIYYYDGSNSGFLFMKRKYVFNDDYGLLEANKVGFTHSINHFIVFN